MKKKTLLLLSALISITVSCSKKKPIDYVLLSGEVQNLKSKNITITNRNQEILHTIELSDNHKFTDTVIIPEGYYYLKAGMRFTQIYLKPKFQLKLTFDENNFDESLKFEGTGANENNYLSEKSKLESTFGNLVYYGYYGKLNESDFLKLTDSLYNISTSLYKKYENLDSDFSFIESKNLEFQKLNKIAGFENIKRFVSGDKKFKVSPNYPDPFIDINLSNEKLLVSPNYLFLINNYLNKINTKKYLENNSLDNVITPLETIDENIQNEIIKEELAYYVGKWNLQLTKKLDLAFKKYNSIAKNKEYKENIKQKYLSLKKIEKGATSPLFDLKDINNSSVSLSDLKGKLVYIDIWATWCLPCIKEIPSLKKLEEEFDKQDIAFVSICKSDSKKSWQKMVKEKHLVGIQLFAPDDNIPFFNDLMVQSMPRFILLDREGKIIDSNAKRPSDPRLKDELKKLL